VDLFQAVVQQPDQTKPPSTRTDRTTTIHWTLRGT